MTSLKGDETDPSALALMTVPRHNRLKPAIASYCQLVARQSARPKLMRWTALQPPRERFWEVPVPAPVGERT